MPETLTPSPAELSQEEQNEALLGQSELGVILTDAYRTAVNLDPRLADIKISPISDPQDHRYGYATPKWAVSNESGQHEIHVRLDDLDGTLAYYAKAMQDLPAGVDMIASRLGVEPQKVTPQLLYVQSILHEMGHLTEYMDNEGDPAALQHRVKAERAALPIGNVTAGALITPGTKAYEFVEASWDEIQAGLGVASRDDLVARQAREYRTMTSETIADGFATNVFVSNPQMYDQLMQPTVDAYRNFPMAA